MAPDRAQRDADLSPEIKRVWETTIKSTTARQAMFTSLRGGIRKVWHQMQRETFTIARCTVVRLMKRQSIQGVIARQNKEDDRAPLSGQCCAMPCQARDALAQGLHDRRPVHKAGLIYHSDRGGRYLSIRYTERLALAGIEPSVGRVDDPYDNALAETKNGLYKAEVIYRLGPWKTMASVE